MGKLKIVKFGPDFYQKYHEWEVIMPLGDGRYRIEKFSETEKEEQGWASPEDQYQAVCDLINGCRFSNTDYYVFMDEQLTDL